MMFESPKSSIWPCGIAVDLNAALWLVATCVRQETTSLTERCVVVSVTGSPASGFFWKYAQALRSRGTDRTTANFFISLLAFHSADGTRHTRMGQGARGTGRGSNAIIS